MNKLIKTLFYHNAIAKIPYGSRLDLMVLADNMRNRTAFERQLAQDNPGELSDERAY